MQSAKEAVKNFIHKDGSHDTTVQEKVAPAVTNQTTTRTQEDRVTTAIDKETHQDHYHTSVQPVHDREVLPEKHHHNLVGVEHRNFEHDDPSKVKNTLAAEQAKFKSTHDRVEGEHTTRANPTVAGEHVHHHVHETIQPVVNKQTVEPHVVHTTVPIHEVHHNAAQHHSTTALPAMSMSDFKKQGGSLTGREERSDAFEGCPRPGQQSTGGTANSIESVSGHNHGTHGHSHGTTGASGLTGSSTTGSSSLRDNVPSTTGTRDDGLNAARGNTGINSAAGSGVAGGSGLTGSSGLRDNVSSTTGTRDDGLNAARGNTGINSAAGSGVAGGSGLTGSGSHGSSTTTGKPSVMDKLNPNKDADGDGKAGFMK